MWSGLRTMLPRPVFWSILLLICLYAFWRGRKYERLAAGVCLAASIATHFVIGPVPHRYSGIEYGLFGIDLAVLAAFVAIALRSDRFWPLWTAGLQLTISMSHVLKAVDLHLMARAYAAAAVFWSYPILFIIALASWRQHRRGARPGGSAAAT